MADAIIALAKRVVRAVRRARERRLARQYRMSGRQAWSPGYVESRREYVQRRMEDSLLLDILRTGGPLPNGYGADLDERAVELPWVMSHLARTKGRLLDAGSSLNHEYLVQSPMVRAHATTIVTLAPESSAFWRAGISYAYEDLRALPFRDGWFDVIACVSTIEHVGMDTTMYAPAALRPPGDAPRDWIGAVHELWRVLKPGGALLITFPFGRFEDHGWLQQFDATMTDQLLAAVNAARASERIYAWSRAGWQVSTREACADLEYFDVHASLAAPDGAAAARAVCCLQLIKRES